LSSQTGVRAPSRGHGNRACRAPRPPLKCQPARDFIFGHAALLVNARNLCILAASRREGRVCSPWHCEGCCASKVIMLSLCCAAPMGRGAPARRRWLRLNIEGRASARECLISGQVRRTRVSACRLSAMPLAPGRGHSFRGGVGPPRRATKQGHDFSNEAARTVALFTLAQCLRHQPRAAQSFFGFQESGSREDMVRAKFPRSRSPARLAILRLARRSRGRAAFGRAGAAPAQRAAKLSTDGGPLSRKGATKAPQRRHKGTTKAPQRRHKGATKGSPRFSFLNAVQRGAPQRGHKGATNGLRARVRFALWVLCVRFGCALSGSLRLRPSRLAQGRAQGGPIGAPGSRGGRLGKAAGLIGRGFRYFDVGAVGRRLDGNMKDISF
jgi:hypothetical protein